MKVPHILMANGDILFTLPSGPKYVTPFQFNYQRIRRELPIDDTLLDTLSIQPSAPNGVFHVYPYTVNDTPTLLVYNINNDSVIAYLLDNNKFIKTSTDVNMRNDRPLGVYISLHDILLDFPEFSI